MASVSVQEVASPAQLSPTEHLGYYGKLPSFGDFVSKRLPVSFVEPWDAWLSRCIVDSQRMLGERWFEVYLNSPIWRFALGSGICGDSAYMGVLLPSVDAVERCYPFAIVGEVPADVPVIDRALAVQGWFEELEDLALSALDDDGVDEQLIDGRLEEMAERARVEVSLPMVVAGAEDGIFVAEVPESMGWPDAMHKSLEQLSSSRDGSRCAWWTAGSPNVPATVLHASGLPSPRCYSSMMTGNWGVGPV